MFGKKLVFAMAVIVTVSLILSACAPPTPEVIEKERVVEKPVVQTVVVEREKVVEKPVVETVVVEKEVEKVVTPTPAPEELRRVLVTLDWPPNSYQTWLFVGIQKGFYEAEGIEVLYYVPTNVETALAMTGAGRTDIGLSVSADTILGVANAELPIKVISTIFAGARTGTHYYPEDTPTEADMKGKTWGVIDSGPWRLCFWKTLEAAGLTPDDVEIVDIGFDTMPAFITGEIAGNTSTWGAEQLKCQHDAGRRVMVFEHHNYGPQDNFNIMANAEWAEENPELVKAFLRGTYKALKFARENPEDAVEVFVSMYPERNLKRETQSWCNFAVQFGTTYSEEKGFGWNDPDEWQALIDFFWEGGLLDRKPTLDEVVTNEYQPDEPIFGKAPLPLIPDEGDSPVIDAIKEAGKLRAGIAESEFSEPAIEIASLVADRLGVELELVESSPDTILDDLRAGKFDLAASGIPYTPETVRAVDLAVFYMDGPVLTHVGVAMNKGDLTWVHFVDFTIASRWADIQAMIGER
jgi:putative hydroxymethylpyrimidine transport system substrate-binding protein